MLIFVGLFSIAQADSGLTVQAQNIPIRPLIEKIATVLHDNIIITEDVTGNVSLNLQNVTWQHALNIVLKTQDLVSVTKSGITIIMPAKRYADQQQTELQFQQKLSELVPLKYELLTIHYANADVVATLLSRKSNGFLSDRGKVSFDGRTNSLLIEDIPNNISNINELIAKLDVPVRQVLIKARIVNLDRQFEYEVGVRFGLSKPEPVTGSLVNNGRSLGQVFLPDKLNFDMPATSLFNSPGKVGLSVAKISSDVLVDLELSAMERQHLLKIVASPRLIASHGEQALIESGTEIPYEQRSDGGATSAAFKKAVLSLNVKPLITENNKVILTLDVTQDKPGELTSKGLTIKTEHMKTQLLMDDGQTMVIGGIYETTQQNSVDKVPFFSALPIVGNLFIHKITVNNTHELLIFITPEILKQTGV